MSKQKNSWSQTGKYLIGDYFNRIKIEHNIYFLYNFINVTVKTFKKIRVSHIK